MTTESEREKHRRPTGQFGQHDHTAPEQLLPNRRLLADHVHGHIEHRTESRGWFGRTRTNVQQVPVALRLDNWTGTPGIEGERGERIIDGQAYLPALRGKEHAPADDQALASLLRHSIEQLPNLDDKADPSWWADHYLNDGPARAVIIDDMLWVRASHASWAQF